MFKLEKETKKYILRHFISYLKTFVVVFIGILYVQTEAGIDIGTQAFWVTAGASFIRTVYKIIVEDLAKVELFGR